MKTQSTLLLILTFAGCIATVGWPASFNARAQTATPTSPTAPTPSDRIAHGRFRSSDGSTGTYVETYVISDSTETHTIVYTAFEPEETRTETLITTTNADGTKGVVYSDLGFGAAVAFTSTTTYTSAKGGSAVGTGIFTAADGTTGVLAAVVAPPAMDRPASPAPTSPARTECLPVKCAWKRKAAAILLKHWMWMPQVR